MSDESGIEVMRARMQRARRQPPSPRNVADASARESPTPGADAAPVVIEAHTPAPELRGPSAEAMPSPRRAGRTPLLRLSARLPWVNLAIRVRRPLDDRLVDLIHELRRQDVRTSKVEVIEMLLWELPPDDVDGLRRRLVRFRRHAPRAASAELED